MRMDLTPPRITRIADGFLVDTFVDVDYTNVMDCVYMIVEVEDNESPVDHLDVAVLYNDDEYLLEPHYFGCPATGCSVGKVRTQLYAFALHDMKICIFIHAGNAFIRKVRASYKEGFSVPCNGASQ